mmetsp:Transcript_37409/g.73342  ORF Transcript_37409/g.73342 Transcript_37409/m.73342 type:complete len:92 (-) Transcript_37409:303-578(-)
MVKLGILNKEGTADENRILLVLGKSEEVGIDVDEETPLLLGMIEDGGTNEGYPLGLGAFEDAKELGVLEVEGTDEDKGISVVLGIFEDGRD